MTVVETGLPGLLLIDPTVYEDDRGFFFEGYNRRAFAEAGLTEELTQLNQSFSRAGVLRGLHYQVPPDAQSKLVRCNRGRLFDVAVDLRQGSPTVGQWFGVELTEESRRTLFVPVGFAHGFYALTDCELVYLCGQAYYNRPAEQGIAYDDPALSIRWPLTGQPVMNERDRAFPRFEAAAKPFHFTQ